MYNFCRLASRVCKFVSNILGFKWEIRGHEFLAKEQACVIVANHQSSLDILGMFDLWPIMEKCTVVAKRELFYAWPFGLAAWLCGLIFIDRMNTEKARTTINEATNQLIENKVWILFFFLLLVEVRFKRILIAFILISADKTVGVSGRNEEKHRRTASL